MPMTAREHLEWARTQAFEYLDAGDLTNALASMASDLTKHRGTARLAPDFGRRGIDLALRAEVGGLRALINELSVEASIVCPKCHMESYNPHDIEEGYCGNCKTWTSGRLKPG